MKVWQVAGIFIFLRPYFRSIEQPDSDPALVRILFWFEIGHCLDIVSSNFGRLANLDFCLARIHLWVLATGPAFGVGSAHRSGRVT